MKKVFDRNVINKYFFLFLFDDIISNLFDYISARTDTELFYFIMRLYIYMHVCHDTC